MVEFQLTTDKIKELAAKGKRVASGSKVSSTVDSAQRALLKVRQEEEARRKFMERRLGSRAIAEQRTADLKKRAAAEAAAEAAKRERMITVSNNSKALPSYTAQTQIDFSDVTKYKVHGNNNRVSNNKVTPESVYVNPNVTVTGSSKTSKPSYFSIAASENYNYASQMNDFTSANPSSDINMGAANPQPNIWWKSAAPQDNSVQTEDLGGDIQHQETDNYTNVSDLPFQNSPPSDTNWADSFSQVSVGTLGLGLAALGVLLQLGKKK